MAALRHLARAGALTSLVSGAVMLPQQQLLRAAPVASLLSLGSLLLDSGFGQLQCRQGCTASAAPAGLRSFASSAASHTQQQGPSSSSSSSLHAGSVAGSAQAAAAPSSSPAAGSAAAPPVSVSQQQQERAAHSGPLPMQQPPPQQQPQLKSHFKVEAGYVGSRISIYDLMHRPEFGGHYKKLHKGSVVLGLRHGHVDPSCEIQGMPMGPYLVAFSYGSVVFFNTDKELKEAYLAVCREEAADPVPLDKPYTEEYAVTVDPAEPYWSRLEADCVTLQALDLRNIQVIAQVLAQSVAMDFYSSHVERTLETFCSINLEMQETKNIAKINKQVLLQMVASNNIILADIINKLGVHERYDIAWKHVQYGRIWEFLRSELEMDARFKTLDMKLNLIQDNLKYFLEILQNRKSDSLEWIIIILIGAEICLSLYDLANKGLGG